MLLVGRLVKKYDHNNYDNVLLSLLLRARVVAAVFAASAIFGVAMVFGGGVTEGGGGRLTS
tara:strand:- start:42 stop:224 length:183 start_codon:yes stop_codon:yes gene_type:complete